MNRIPIREKTTVYSIFTHIDVGQIDIKTLFPCIRLSGWYPPFEKIIYTNHHWTINTHAWEGLQ
jgi:hypothetical protein